MLAAAGVALAGPLGDPTDYLNSNGLLPEGLLTLGDLNSDDLFRQADLDLATLWVPDDNTRGVPLPEPATLGVVALGAAAALLRRRRRCRPAR
jgi:hypothetical protein